MIRKTTLTLFSFLWIAISYSQTANFTASLTQGCSPVVVRFQDQSTGGITSWFWDFGNGATATLQNPSTTYFTPGSYTVTLTVTNSQGTNTLTRTQYILVYPKPAINFTVNDSTACFPHPAQFTDLSVAGPGTVNTTWLWDFGDGSQATSQNPRHVYTSSGNYTVTLKATNDKGCYSVLNKTAYVQIAGGVKADFTNTQPTNCLPPFNINFTSNGTGPGTLSYLWNFGDGSTSTQINPSHSYTTTGNYAITYVISSTNGCSDTLRKDTTLNIENISTRFNVPDSVCLNNAVNFQNTSSPNTYISNWNFGDGTSDTARNPIKIFTTAGTYTVQLTNTYKYCSDVVTKSIKVLPRPLANFTSDVRYKCEPSLNVNFQDQSTNAINWFWNFGDGATSTQQNPSHTYSNYGDYDVKLVVTNLSGCTDTLTMPAYIRIQRPVITFPSLPVKGCIPFGVGLIPNINTLDNVTSYLWDFGDGSPTSTAASPSHSYTVQGTYSVTLTITTSSGCTETYTHGGAVKVGRRPIVNFSAIPRNACAFQTVTFTDLTNEADEWEWIFGDGGVASQQNPTYEYTDTGWMNVKLYATNNGCKDSFQIDDYIYIKPPIARFGFNTSCTNRLRFDFKDSSIGANSWLWNFGDGTTSTLKDPPHDFPDFGIYNVSLTVSNDTCSHTMTKVVRVINENPDFVTPFTSSCRGSTYYFNAIVGSRVNIIEYDWDFGDGNTWNSILKNSGDLATNYYNTAGYYTVNLITTDIYGCKDTTTKVNYIRINGPTANFTVNNVSGCTGSNYIFTDLSQNDGISPIVSWKFDFGDSTAIQTFTGPPFEHIYTKEDTFSIRLTVTDAGGCTDNFLRNNYIRTTSSKANFVTADTLACPGSTVTFTNTSTYPKGSGYDAVWYFGDGNSSTRIHDVNRYADTGVYTVKLVITDYQGCIDSITKINYVKVARPYASFTMSDSISSCTPFEVQFTNTSQYYRATLWDLGGGMSTLDNPVQFYNSPGIYPIKLLVGSWGACYDSAFGVVRVFDTTGSKITYLPLDGCKPLLVDLDAYSPGPMSYTWDFGDGVLISNDSTSMNHVYNFFGDFIPKVIMTDPAGCIIPVAGKDTINIKGATVKFGSDKRLLCDSGLVRFIDSTVFNDSLSVYNWDFGDGNTSHLQNPTHYYSSTGNYNVMLNVLTQNACVDTFRLNTAIKVVESPLISIGGDSVICIHDYMQHLGVYDRPDTSAVRWSWEFPNNSSAGVQYPLKQQYNTSGNFIVKTIAINSSGCVDSATKNIRINPLPTVTLPSMMSMQAGFPITIPAVYSPKVNSYMWTPSNTLNCTDCPQPIAHPKFNTKYTVSFVDSNGCKNTGETQIVVFCKAANVFIPNTFSPNADGSNDVFYVRGKGLDRVKSLRIFNRWGEVVFEKTNFPVNDANFGWDGKYRGNTALPDVYVYQVEIFCDNSDIMRFEGNIALIK